MKNYGYLYFCAVIASCAGLLSGFDTGVISGALLYISKSFTLTPELSGMLVGAVSVGAVFGALINGIIIDRFGRKKVLILSAIIFLFGSIGCLISKSIFELIVFRTLLGLAVGIVSFAAPLYLSEISIKEKRGQIVSFYQLAITFGILFSYFINYVFSSNVYSWRLMLSFGAAPALVLLIGMLFQSDTPRWYILKGNTNLAERCLEKLNPYVDAKKEAVAIQDTIINSRPENFKLSKKLIIPFIIGIGIMFVQVSTGINAIIYYAPTIFKSLNLGSNQSILFLTILIGLINFLMTFVAITFVDKWGRKPLLYIGLFGMTFSLALLSLSFSIEGIKYLSILGCAIYIISFSMSLGPIALLLISEVFPLKYRGFAMSVSIVSNFVFNFIVTGLFPVALDKIGGSVTFAVFALICIASIIFVKFIVPETKAKSLEEIEANWN